MLPMPSEMFGSSPPVIVRSGQEDFKAASKNLGKINQTVQCHRERTAKVQNQESARVALCNTRRFYFFFFF